jgi:hypothetical protein
VNSNLKIIPANKSGYGLPVVDGTIIGLGDPRTLERVARAMPATDLGCFYCSRTFTGSTRSIGAMVGGKRKTFHVWCFHKRERHLFDGCPACALGFTCGEGMIA